MEKQKKQSLVAAPGGKSYLVPFVLITSLFLLWGFAHGLLDVLNKHFQGVFTMTKAESGLVQFSTYIAYFLMALPAGAFMKRYGYRKGIIMGLLLFAIGAFGFIPAAFLHSAYAFPDRLVCDRLRALYLGDGGVILILRYWGRPLPLPKRLGTYPSLLMG